MKSNPILTTSIAFIARIFPPVASGGAGEVKSVATAILTATLLITLTSGCAGWLTVGPDYKQPANAIPSAYKSAESGKWKIGETLDDVPKGNWWELFGDTNLNTLETQALRANQQLKGTVARVDQARATARVARSEFLPAIDFNPSYQRERYSPNAVPSFGNVTANTFSTPLDLSYEVDIWGRVRRNFESSRADAQASLAEFYNVLLTLNSDVAQNYFSLRSLDAEIATVASTVALRHEQVRLVSGRFQGGVGNNLDVAQAQTDLATTEVEAASLGQLRDRLENAIAILVGQNPSVFKLPALMEANWNPQPPEIPAGLPDDLLERRPDVAQAERLLASANAKIGVAKAAFFPVVTLTGSGGYLSADVTTLFNWESRVWTFGPGVSLPIFSGGRNQANYRRSKAAYQEAVANYRQRVLVAFGDVENSLSAIRHLAQQSEAQERAMQNARRATELATHQYRAGVVAYIQVVDASRDSLTAERANAQLAGQRLIAAVQLIKTLGGGWDEKQISPDSSKSSYPTIPAK
jgi:outer membrane protein, multidrug efflux system